MKQIEVEKLLQRRIKVLSPYPLSPYKVGDYVELSDSGNNARVIESGDSSFWMPTDEIIKMPLVFNVASWWEDREVSEMPTYLKSSETFPNPHYVKVNKHYGVFFEGEYHGKDVFKPYWEAQYSYYFPATESDYQSYLTNQ